MRHLPFVLIIMLALVSPGFAQNKPVDSASKKPAQARKAPERKPAAPEPEGVSILLEYIEVEHGDFSDWVFENRLSADATPLRKEIQEWIEEEDAEVIETVVLQARSGQRAQVESIEEHIYPTSFDPAEIPNEVSLDEAEAPLTPPNAATFETRNIGSTLEVDPVVGEDKELIDLNLSPELVFHLDDREHFTMTGEQDQMVMTPLFYTAKVTTQVSVRNGGYSLVGTVRLPEYDEEDEENDRLVLIFVRADAD